MKNLMTILLVAILLASCGAKETTITDDDNTTVDTSTIEDEKQVEEESNIIEDDKQITEESDIIEDLKPVEKESISTIIDNEYYSVTIPEYAKLYQSDTYDAFDAKLYARASIKDQSVSIMITQYNEKPWNFTETTFQNRLAYTSYDGMDLCIPTEHEMIEIMMHYSGDETNLIGDFMMSLKIK